MTNKQFFRQSGNTTPFSGILYKWHLITLTISCKLVFSILEDSKKICNFAGANNNKN